MSAIFEDLHMDIDINLFDCFDPELTQQDTQ